MVEKKLPRQLPRLPNVARLEIAAVAEIYALLSESDELYVPLQSVLQKLELGIGPALIRRALREAANRNQLFEFDAQDDLFLTDEGFEFIQKNQDNLESTLHDYLGFGSEWVLEARKPITAALNATLDDIYPEASATAIPASDREVALDHNSASYKEATIQLDAVIDEIENDRRNDFQDKDKYLAELRAGRELLRSSTVNPSTMKVVLYGCLGYLATKFADEPIGTLAHLAWTAVKTLLGH